MASEDSLQIESAIRDEIGYVALDGKLIAESRYALERLLRDWLDSGVRGVAVSLRGLEYMESTGLATLIGAYHRLRSSGGDLVLCEVNQPVGAMLSSTSMEKSFSIFPTVKEAEEHLKQTAAARRRKGARSVKGPEQVPAAKKSVQRAVKRISKSKPPAAAKPAKAVKASRPARPAKKPAKKKARSK